MSGAARQATLQRMNAHHLNEFGTRDTEEWHFGLSCSSLGKQGLTSTRRTRQYSAPRDLSTELLIFLRRLEELDKLHDLLFRLIHTRNIRKLGLDVCLLVEHLGARLADAEYASGSTATAATQIGHVHLRVAELDRAVAFYRDVIGLEVVTQGKEAAFLSAGGYHHHIALNTWGSKGGKPPPPGSTGLFHTAFVYPDRPALARALQAVLDAGVQLTGAADHGVSEAVYFDDPDGNGVELYRDRPRADWPRDAEGGVILSNSRLDLEALLAEAS